MHVNPPPAHVAPYRPSLYLPGSLGRFRQYPRVVTARVPGVGYKVGRGVWGAQRLYLGGYGDPPAAARYQYGRYTRVPLLGLGQVVPWYEHAWVWAAAGSALLLAGVGSYMALRRNRRARRNRRRRSHR